MSGPPAAISPLAPASFPDLPAVAGVEAAVGRAGFYKHERADVLLVRVPAGARAAGVFTTNAVGSAPTDWCKQALAANRGNVRGLLVNAGCANSFTGAAGDAACRRALEAAGEKVGAPARELMAASTGVIGVVLDDAKIIAALPRMELAPIDWRAAAEAIMTTDTFPKGAGARCAIDGADVALAGFCKGSGMIAPNMATMLAFVFTDAAISAPILKSILRDENETSFNSITVDGDRSTNDCVLLLATGRAKVPPIADAHDSRLNDFRAALRHVLSDLAIQIVRDGEGATKLVKVTVTGAANALSAKRIARTICESPLVKTAIAGEDANWGRIVAAAGRADQPMQREMMSVRFGELWAARDGAVAPDYDEAATSAYMKRPELEISVNVGPGMGTAVMHTCDLTKRYVEINGDYRS
ncbi:MAG TPA: bifunctional glutamate N-acetyltransferase/amino-acid acetyltransferase ArgJ [Caulobacterales bacterium]|nr:bifunctional glutamate N-acetyltransferase/amino-acid acetyltransferase ArgJ [Caulobacterales bacterium]